MSLLRQAVRCFANQQNHQPLNAFIGSSIEYVQKYVDEAVGADVRLEAGTPKSVLDGRFIAVKDNICAKDEPTTCASKILDGFLSPNAATVVEKLNAAGALVIGKTNLDEFGMGSHSLNSHYKPVINYLDTDGELLSAGGSSGGSAVAVATGQCYAALGTDTGGSVRLPAAYTGILGFKPSYGVISRRGVVAYANSLDTVGVLAENSQAAKAVYDVIKGHDPDDPTSISHTTRSIIEDRLRKRKKRKPLRIGVPIEYNVQELDPVIRKAWLDTLVDLQKRGHVIKKISLPTTRSALSAYYILAPAEASSNLAKYDGVRYGNKNLDRKEPCDVLFARRRGDGFGAEVKRRILLGSYSLSAAAMDNYFIKAQKIRRLVQKDFNNVFALAHPLLESITGINEGGIDVIISPTALSFPPKLSALAGNTSINTYSDDILTVPASLAGLPAISVPIPCPGTQNVSGRLKSIGLQIIAQYGDDDLVFEAARLLE